MFFQRQVLLFKATRCYENKVILAAGDF